MLKTHTGRSIIHEYQRRVVTCGAWSVAERDIYENRPGRARQMRRMVAKARRRVRKNGGCVFVLRANMQPERIASFRDYFTRMASDSEPVVIDIPPGDYSAPFVLPDGARFPVDDEPETEFERAAVNVARDDVARGDVISLDDAKVSLAGGK